MVESPKIYNFLPCTSLRFLDQLGCPECRVPSEPRMVGTVFKNSQQLPVENLPKHAISKKKICDVYRHCRAIHYILLLCNKGQKCSPSASALSDQCNFSHYSMPIAENGSTIQKHNFITIFGLWRTKPNIFITQHPPRSYKKTFRTSTAEQNGQRVK